MAFYDVIAQNALVMVCGVKKIVAQVVLTCRLLAVYAGELAQARIDTRRIGAVLSL
jgi:hypothetical protein